MKPLYRLLLYFVVLASFGVSCSPPTGWEEQGLKGAVKSFTEKSYQVVLNGQEWEPIADLLVKGHQLQFGPDGSLAGATALDEQGDIAFRFEMELEDGQLVEQTTYNAQGEETGRTRFTWVSPTEAHTESLDKAGTTTGKERLWFKQGRLLYKEWIVNLDRDDPDTVEFRFEYDDKRHLAGYQFTDERGDTEPGTVFRYLEYDAHDNWTKRLVFNGNDLENPAGIELREYEYF